MAGMRVGRRFFVQFLGAQTATRQRRDLYIICLPLSLLSLSFSLLPLFLLPFPCFSPFSYRLPKMTNGDKGGERTARNVTTLDWPETRARISVARSETHDFGLSLKIRHTNVRISNISRIYIKMGSI